MASWGDVNAALNRLVREGVITGFKTNLANPDRGPELLVAATATVVADSDAAGYDRAAVESIREVVANRLAALVENARVTIEPALPDVVR
jgi:hypothetical protein